MYRKLEVIAIVGDKGVGQEQLFRMICPDERKFRLNSGPSQDFDRELAGESFGIEYQPDASKLNVLQEILFARSNRTAVVFNLGDRPSFDRLESYLEHIQTYGGKNHPVTLIAMDPLDGTQPVVTQQDIDTFMQDRPKNITFARFSDPELIHKISPGLASALSRQADMDEKMKQAALVILDAFKTKLENGELPVEFYAIYNKLVRAAESSSPTYEIEDAQPEIEAANLLTLR